jgi:carboxypeptidase C (cathepsin A)
MYSGDNFGMAKVGNEIKTYKKYYTAADYTPWMYGSDYHEAKKSVEMLPPCVYGSYVVDYLNRYAVRDALHIPDSVQAWTYCTADDSWSYASGKNASYDIYPYIKKNYPEARMLFYSGDTDGSVPTWGSLEWIDSLGWEQTKEWTPYYYEKQVAGYTQEHAPLTFGSVHGCGHMAPQWKRPETWHLIFSWMDKKDP